ncbi:TonB-dependent receptor plug domain-containing protein [Pseudomonas quasicaspiana]|uniref:TonB-dependent receptor plug domain-containing protein n=1 Tax=Pseudomonas quasicaspiana TaxID=2829821 RepID=UPI001E4C7EBC|nr:TonB-dependent receptor plug domain-containing protein [Pseudomonas quasicaspiana]MCD5977844.1 TonB-dependent receptor plug domain-containing protein [Pseudomonas quasicaspiana]
MAKDFSHNPHLGVNRQWAGLAGIGALTLCCALTTLPAFAVSPSGTEQAAMQAQHNFDIPAQSLASALISFGQQSGLQVSVDSALLENRTSRSVSGSLSSAKALDNLLKGSGVGWTYSYGNLLLYRDEPLAGEDAAMEIGTTVVLGSTEEKSYMGETVIGEKAIKAFPGANGDITTLLRMHPSVQFSNTQQSSNTPGELNPANISINGAKYYQNNFMIDGISINNDLDPGAQSYGATRNFESAPSNSHGIALDADLLQEVKVYDSNVPAEYGGFNGGVVDAITRKPTEALHGKISASMTRSEWMRYHISEGDEVDFATASNEQYQPEFEKLTVRGSLEGHFTEDFGAMVAFSQKRSDIALHGYAGGYNSPDGESNSRNQSRQIDNYLVKTYWNINDRLTLDSSFTYAPQEGKYFTADRRNADFTTLNGGSQATFKAVWSGDKATWTHKLALTDVTSSRDTDATEMVSWYYSQEKNWGNPNSASARSIDGAVTSLDQRQRSLTYGLKSEWVPLQFAGMEHTFTAGMDLSHTVAEWERAEDYNSVTTFRRDNGNTCLATERWCSVSPLLNGQSRQWASLYTEYGAGKIEMTENKYAFYLQDSLQFGKLGLRPGVRIEGDDYMEQKTVAPRFAGDYDFFGDRSTVAVFGANRYYGRNLFKYRLADGRQGLNTTYRRTTYGAAFTGTRQLNSNRFSTLNIPYDDELMAGVEQRWFDTEFKLKYVHRLGKDKIVRASSSTQNLPDADGYVNNYYTYTNQGRSESDNISLTITPLQDLEWMGTKTSLQWAFDWSRTKDASVDYESLLTLDKFEDDNVVYDGKLTKYSELPASDFNRPWTARMTAITEIPQWHLTVSNFLRYRGAYDQIYNLNEKVVVDGESLDVYRTVRVNAAPTWDMRVDWEVPTGKDQAAFIAVDVTNVADRVNTIKSSATTTTYEVGRQYWLEVGYRF